MEFQSIEQIRRELGISATAPDEVRREVHRRLWEVHPDALTGAGLPDDSDKRDETLRLTAALNLLDSPEVQQGALVPIEQVTDLVKVFRDLMQVNQGQNAQPREQDLLRREKEAAQTLSQQSDTIVQQVRSAGRLPLISLTAVSALLTVIWLFPATVQSHPILGHYVDSFNLLRFTLVWLVSLFITAATWVILKWRSQAEELFQRTLNLETTQNVLFSEFLRDRHQLARDIGEFIEQILREERAEHQQERPHTNGLLEHIKDNWLYKAVEGSDDTGLLERLRERLRKRLQKGITEYSDVDRAQLRDHFLSFAETLVSHNSSLRDIKPEHIPTLLYDPELRSFDEFQKADFVYYVEARSVEVKRSVARHNASHPFFLLSRRIPLQPLQRIDAELAQNIANLILTRAEAQGTVKPIPSPSLDPRYSLAPPPADKEGDSA